MRRTVCCHSPWLMAAGGIALLAVAGVIVGCGGPPGTAGGNGHAEPKITVIEPSADAQTKAIEALITAEPDQIIEFGEGMFEFTSTLSLDDVENVTIRGRGMDKTRLSFKNLGPGTGGEGIKVTANGFVIEDLTVEDTPGDAIKVEGAKGVTFRRVRAIWTGGPDEDNGAYGLYPVLCSDVLIEECVAECASDAGIYVGQSENVVVRRSKAMRNVAGIEIENTVGADVHDNEATDNTGGILVFSLPGLPKKNGANCRVWNNRIDDNNHPNFAKAGNVVATVPPGSGLIIMANDNVEVFNNVFQNNQTANVSIISYTTTGRPFDDPEYDPYPEGIHIHSNRFEGGGDKPSGEFGSSLALVLGTPFPDIIYDGVIDENKLVDGELPPELRVYIENNGEATFANFNYQTVFTSPNVERDLAPYAGGLPPLAQIELPGAE